MNELLKKYKREINELSDTDKVKRELYLRDLALGNIQGALTGYPSIDKIWLQYYKEEQIDNLVPNTDLITYIEEQNKDNLDLFAIDGVEGRYTYREMFNISDMVAKSLHKMGIEKGKKVVTMYPNVSYEDFTFYGIAKAGAAILPLIPEYTKEQVCQAINEVEAEYFFVFDGLLTLEMEQEIYAKTNVKNIIVASFGPICGRDEKTISWQEFLEVGKDYEMPDVKRSNEDLLFIAKTGGTTGNPKSVMLNDKSFITLVHQYIHSDLPYEKGDRWIRLWPIFSATAAVSSFFLAHAAGMEEVIRFFPKFEDFGTLVKSEKINHWMLIPMLLDALEKNTTFTKEEAAIVKSAGVGGIPLSNDLEQRMVTYFKNYGIDIFIGYGWGLTENGSSAAGRMNDETTKMGAIGIPWSKTNVTVFQYDQEKEYCGEDPRTEIELGYDDEGELAINSESIMMGYYGDDFNTNMIKRRHSDGSTWLHTGDLGIIDRDGFVTVKGRATKCITTFPVHKNYPAALENIIASIPGVANVAVIGAPDPDYEGFEMIVCCLVPEDGIHPDELKEKVDNILTSQFPQNERPRDYVMKEFFPLNVAGKPDIPLLEKEYLENRVLKRTK